MRLKRQRYPLIDLALGASLLAALLIGAGLVYGVISRQVVEFSPLAGALTNPLMGWAPWANETDIRQPHTLVYADLTWREFEPEQGVYDFASFERINQFDRWRREGKRVVFRFVLDKPGNDPHIDIPDWLWDLTGRAGDRYNTEYGRGFSPDYASDLIIEYHRQAIAALGRRYGQDDFIAFIELGSLGHWGEWHVKYDEGLSRLPPAAVRDVYVQHYLDAFPNTPLLMRRPFAIAAARGLGLYNDMTGSPEATETWLDWIANGGAYDQTGEDAALAPMPDGWQTAPTGGEQTGDRDSAGLYAADLDQTLDLLRRSHATFIGPRGPYNEDPGGPLQPGLDRVLETIGYRLYVSRAELPRWVHFGRGARVTLTLANAGVAPMYASWPVRVYLFDEAGKTRAITHTRINLREVLPGEGRSYPVTLPVGGIENGVYTVGIAVIDPATGNPGVRLAMEDAGGDLVYEVGTFEVRRVGATDS